MTGSSTHSPSTSFDDQRVGGDVVRAAELTDGDVGGDVLALERPIVATLAHGDRLTAVPALAWRDDRLAPS